jgi:hypothetical protein
MMGPAAFIVRFHCRRTAAIYYVPRARAIEAGEAVSVGALISYLGHVNG